MATAKRVAVTVRAIGNVLNLSTPAGITVGLAGRARFHRGAGGLILADGYRRRFPFAGAFTVGNVIITSGEWARIRAERPHVLRHEERHTWQWLALGPAFLPAYGAAMVWSWWRTGDRASANWFERSAGLADGEYRERPVRSGSAAARDAVRVAFGRRLGKSRTALIV